MNGALINTPRLSFSLLRQNNNKILCPLPYSHTRTLTLTHTPWFMGWSTLVVLTGKKAPSATGTQHLQDRLPTLSKKMSSSSGSLPSLESIEVIEAPGTEDSDPSSAEEEGSSPRYLQPRRRRSYYEEPALERPTQRNSTPTITVDWDRELILPSHNLRLAWNHSK